MNYFFLKMTAAEAATKIVILKQTPSMEKVFNSIKETEIRIL